MLDYIEQANKNLMFDSHLYHVNYYIRRNEYKFGEHLCNCTCNESLKKEIQKVLGLEEELTMEFIQTNIWDNSMEWVAKLIPLWQGCAKRGQTLTGIPTKRWNAYDFTQEFAETWFVNVQILL